MGSYLVVGGSSDIALLLCRKLIDDGHRVSVLARDQRRLSELRADLDKVFIGDANNEDLVREAVLFSIENGEGRLDGVAHMVGSFAVRPPHAMSVDSFEDVIRTNLTSAFVTLSIACKQMLRNGGGRVVFTSSVAGSLGLVNHEAVSAAKGGVESMARSAAATYARRGIRVNVVAPGLTDTRLSAPITTPDASKRAAVGMIPLRRINLPQEVSDTIHWLLTSAPDNITGQVLHLDGGMSKVKN
ncbi:MAG: SDR family NAD(P)-dependent oxidoreductase [Candidatus Thalassarchaeaceae archaeon]|nr:SDR family NAD(P)-dependent oxidoreductase [Candidatus Thalassarchaeaceae archaeon]